MKFSCFAGFGFWKFSSKPSRPESIYNALVAAQGGNFDESFDGPMAAGLFAKAKGLARARAALEHAENQADALTAQEMLPVLEDQYGLAPEPDDTKQERREKLARRMLAAVPNTYVNVYNALKNELEAEFGEGALVAYRPTPTDEGEQSGDISGPGTFKPSNARRKHIQIAGPVWTGTDWYDYTHVGGDSLKPAIGEEWVIEPGRKGLQEKIVVIDSTDTQIRAAFTRSHDKNSMATAAPWPYWESTLRHVLVVVLPELAALARTRRIVEEVLERMLGGTVTWDVVESSGDGLETEPMRVGETAVGSRTIGTIAL